MASLEAIREEWRQSVRSRPVHPSMTFTEDGLVLGAGTVLAKAGLDRCDRPEATLNKVEERVAALLAAAYGTIVSRSVFDHIRRASDQWGRGETSLALIHLAYTGLPKLEDPEEASFRLFLSDRALTDGVTPYELLKACCIEPESVDLLKAHFNPAQPRVPAGHGLESGRWAGPDAPTVPLLPPKPPVELVAYKPAPAPKQRDRQRHVELARYKPVHGLPDDAKVVIPPDGTPIEDEDSSTHKLMAPPRADFRKVYAAGQSIAREPPLFQAPLALAAIGQGGTFDFQRDPAQGLFYHAYKNAANYAVGVYMAGAGYSLADTFELAQAYALVNSSNYGDPKPRNWITLGWKMPLPTGGKRITQGRENTAL
jgi:hypothetical protein